MPGGDVHMWRVRLDGATPLEALVDTLSPRERRRLDSLSPGPARLRFTVAHGVSRLILGRYLGLDPATLAFALGRHGKPALLDTAGGLEFNLSHADDMALLACTVGRPVGVDVESERIGINVPLIAAEFFTPAERRTLEVAPATARLRSFLRIWTAKEAYVKALGLGLSFSPDRFEVSIRADGSVDVVDPERPASSWWVRSFEPAPGFVGAVAAAGSGLRLSWRDWQ